MSGNRSHPVGVGVAAAALLAGVLTLPGAVSAQLPEVRDSAGIRIVENVAPATGGDGRWAMVDAVPTLEIGKVEGAAPYLFTDVVDAFQTPAGEIVVADQSRLNDGTREIRVFDSAGVHVRTFGGKGEGPGEFRAEPVIGFVPPDTVVAWDYRLRRLTWFGLDAEIRREESLGGTQAGARLPMVLIVTQWNVHPDGTVMVAIRTRESDGKQGLVQRTFSLLISPANSPFLNRIENLPSEKEWVEGSAEASTTAYPAASWTVRTDPPAIVVAGDPEGRWRLSVYDLDGTLRRSIRAPVPRREITGDLEEALRKAMLDRAGTAGERSAARNMPLPDSAPAINGIAEFGTLHNVIPDSSGRIWVRRWSWYWEEELHVYDVIGPSGRWLGWVEMPESVGEIVSIGTDHLLSVARGPFDTPQLRKHRFRRIIREEGAETGSSGTPG